MKQYDNYILSRRLTGNWNPKARFLLIIRYMNKYLINLSLKSTLLHPFHKAHISLRFHERGFQPVGGHAGEHPDLTWPAW